MSPACHVISDGFNDLSEYIFTEDETKPIGIQITEKCCNHCPQMNSVILFSTYRRASPDSSR